MLTGGRPILTPAGKIDPLPWMTAAETTATVAALAAAGPTRFVGGCVRDSVVGREIKDIDIATPIEPERARHLLEAAGIKTVPTGIEHGTITVVIADWQAEVTSLRQDVETFGRRARVAFTDDWEADAARRDLTINAIYCDPDGTLYDPTGGLPDLKAGRVRFVGEPARRIKEDALRILRFFRFHSSYGRGPLDAPGYAACSAAADDLRRLSGERIAAELLRLLASARAAEVVDQMAEADILGVILPEADRRDRLRQLIELEDEPDAERRLAALLRSDVAAARAVAERLRLSARQRERLEVLAELPVSLVGMDRRARRRALYRLGVERFVDLVLLAQAEARDFDDWPALLAEASSWEAPMLPVRGADTLARGVPPGPDVGRLVRAVEDWWQQTDYRADRAACLERLEQLIKKETT